MNNRYYNPEWGRFINADSYGGEVGGNPLLHNAYIYALNNPVKYGDNSGNSVAVAYYVYEFVKAILVIGGVYAGTKALEAINVGVSNALSNPYLSIPTPQRKPKESAQTASKVTTQVNTAVGAAVGALSSTKPQYEESKPCTTAKIVKGDVVRGERLTILESIENVEFGGNVMCDDISSATLVANGFENPIGPEIDKNQKPGYTYYYHYHPDRNSHRHIWFYTTP